MKEEVLDFSGAWAAYPSLRTHPNVSYIEEPAALAEEWDAFSPRRGRSPNLCASQRKVFSVSLKT